MRRKVIYAVLCLLLIMILAGCVGEKKADVKPGKIEKTPALILATTTSTMDTGLLDELLPLFEKKYRVRVKTIAVGTGEALKMGERGDADVLLVHAAEAEEKFVADGYGVNRRDVMYNDFLVIGLPSDPAGIKGASSVVDAFKKIYAKKATFVSRGDDSGTHKKEKNIWEKAQIVPGGDWYIESGQGMAETIGVANEKGGYTLADRGTYLALKGSTNLVILAEKDQILLNPYGVIAVNPQKFPRVNFPEAMKFIEFLTSKEGQKMIGEFGKEEYGEALFTPNAK